MTQVFTVDADLVERSLRIEAANEAILEANKSGWLEINNSGSFLHTRESIQSEQADWDDEDESKNFDFGRAPYWIIAVPGEPIAIHGVEDDDLLCVFDVDEDELEAAVRLEESKLRREGLSEISKASRPSDLASPEEALARRNRSRCM